MLRHYVLAGAAAVALSMAAVPLQTASAAPLPQTGFEKSNAVTLVRRGGRGRAFRGFRGGRRFGGMRPRGSRRHLHRPRHFHRPRRFRVYPRAYYYGGYVPYAYPYYYDDDVYYAGACEGLRRTAERTGRRYWWNRYRRCLRDYD